MKLLFLLVVTVGVGIVTYFLSSFLITHKKKKAKRKLPLLISSCVVVLLLTLIGLGIYSSLNQPDLQCSSIHATTSKLPTSLQTAMDYVEKGNYDYDRGNCTQAIQDYTKSLSLNPHFPETYNNRAYTYMRLREYANALQDLDKALVLKPNYIQALINRGDIHNYYYQVDRQSAIGDYKKAIALGATDNTSVCGHLFLAKHNGWTLGAFIDFFRGGFRSCE